MRLDIIFDTVCPWCFIGKQRFRRAVALRPGLGFDIRWRPFLLNPEIPPEGVDRSLYLERKFGSVYRIQRIYAATRAAGREEGIAFNFEAITRTPSSVNSHRLIQWAAGTDCQEALVERIFRAYFQEGADIGTIEVLARLAGEVGLPSAQAGDYLKGDRGMSEVEADNLRVRRLGVSGVPCFVFDDCYALSGAQEADMLARLMDIVRETETMSVPAL